MVGDLLPECERGAEVHGVTGKLGPLVAVVKAIRS